MQSFPISLYSQPVRYCKQCIMSALTLLSTISMLTSKLQIPLNNLLQSKSVTDITLAYSTESTAIIQAASKAIESAHHYWWTINIDSDVEIEPLAYDIIALWPISSSQDRNFVILTLEVSLNVTDRMTYCISLVLCSYLVLVEINDTINQTYLHELIVNLRSQNVIHYVALLLYTIDTAEKVKFSFIANNGELIILDHFDNNEVDLYDRIFKDQYRLFRTSETINMFVKEFSPDLYKNNPYDAFETEEIFVAGSYVHLAIMIGRYFDGKVKFFMKNLLKDKIPQYEEWIRNAMANKRRIVKESMLPLSYIDNEYDS